MSKVLVTGANGHLGAHLVRELLSRRYDVACMIRKTSDTRGIDGLDVERRYGDVQDRDSFIEAARGCSAIFHCAAIYNYWAKKEDDIIFPVIRGTENLLNAAQENRIERIIYTSSIAAIGSTDNPGKLLKEDDWNKTPINVYIKAKTNGEKLLWEKSNEIGLAVTTVCPSLIVGQYDYRITPSTQFIRNWLNGIGTLWNGGHNFVHARDVAKLHVLALEKGLPGKRYLAIGENVVVPEIGLILQELVGVKPVYIPGFVMNYLGALIMEITCSALNKQPPLTRSWAKEGLGRYFFYDNTMTRQELDFIATGLKSVLTEAISWLLFIGQIRKKVADRVLNKFPPQKEWVK